MHQLHLFCAPDLAATLNVTCRISRCSCPNLDTTSFPDSSCRTCCGHTDLQSSIVQGSSCVQVMRHGKHSMSLMRLMTASAALMPLHHAALVREHRLTGSTACSAASAQTSGRPFRTDRTPHRPPLPCQGPAATSPPCMSGGPGRPANSTSSRSPSPCDAYFTMRGLQPDGSTARPERRMDDLACSPTSGGSAARTEIDQARSSWQACSPTSGGATARTEGGQALHAMCSLQPHVWRLNGTRRGWPSAFIMASLQPHVWRRNGTRRGWPSAFILASLQPQSGGATARTEVGQALESWQACSPTSGGSTGTRRGWPNAIIMASLQPHVWRRNGTHRGWPSAAWQVQLAAPRLAAQRHAQRLAKRCMAGAACSPRSIPGRPRRPRVAPGLSKQRAPSKQR